MLVFKDSTVVFIFQFNYFLCSLLAFEEAESM